jgi:hypothetical protein
MGKRKSLTFEAKIKIIEELEKGVPQRDLSVKHGVSKSVISIKKNKENSRKRIGERAGNKKMKQNRASKFATMEEALLGFVRQARDRNLPLTREIINTKAKEFAENLGNES